jgi:hypothetical protein
MHFPSMSRNGQVATAGCNGQALCHDHGNFEPPSMTTRILIYFFNLALGHVCKMALRLCNSCSETKEKQNKMKPSYWLSVHPRTPNQYDKAKLELDRALAYRRFVSTRPLSFTMDEFVHTSQSPNHSSLARNSWRLCKLIHHI